MSNDKGTWYGWDINLKGGSPETARVQSEAIYQTAKKFSERLDPSPKNLKEKKVSSETEI